MKNTLSKILFLTDRYINNWKKGAAILFMIGILFSMAGFYGYAASLLITWLFDVKNNIDSIVFSIIAIAPFVVGYSRDALKNLDKL